MGGNFDEFTPVSIGGENFEECMTAFSQIVYVSFYETDLLNFIKIFPHQKFTLHGVLLKVLGAKSSGY